MSLIDPTGNVNTLKPHSTIRTRFESVAVRDATLRMGAAEGWAQSLERLEEHLAKA